MIHNDFLPKNKRDKSNFTMEKLKKACLSQVDRININISD